MSQIKKRKAFVAKKTRVLGELSDITCEQIRAILERKESASDVKLGAVVMHSMRHVNEQSRVLSKQTELSAAQMLAHFDI